jgi:hypothetical protein
MAAFHEYKRRGLLPLAGVALAAYYLLVFVPLGRRAASLDGPLQSDWRKLAASLDLTNATALDFLHITNQLEETRMATAVLEDAQRSAAARLALPPDLRAKLNAPFQLFDYQNERSKQMDDLARHTNAQLVVAPAVFAGFPEHTVDLREPELLWPALALTDDFLNTAVRCQVAAIHSLEVSLPLTNSASNDNGARWIPIPLQIEFTASADNATRLIQSLPLRGEELHSAGLPEAPPEKAPLLLERLVIRKQNPEKLDEVRVWLRVVGFVLRD